MQGKDYLVSAGRLLVKEVTPEKLHLSFMGRLDLDSVTSLWNLALATVQHYTPPLLLLDLKQLNYCDSAGIVLIQELERLQVTAGRRCTVTNLPAAFTKLLRYMEHQEESTPLLKFTQSNLPEYIGHITIDLFHLFRENIEFFGAVCYQFWLIIFAKRKIRARDFFRFIVETGPQALPIVALIGFLIGLISTFQAAPSLQRFGAEIYLVNLVGLGLVREMGPLLTAVLLAGRTASAFAAELGTMKVNQELDALHTMGLSPIALLVVPRILAIMVVTPLLEIFFIIFGLLGAMVVMGSLGYGIDTFLHQLYSTITPLDYFGGVSKVFVFGVVVAGIGTLQGLKTGLGAQAVGQATTRAVVSSLIMLVVVDGIFALIYYVVGI